MNNMKDTKTANLNDALSTSISGEAISSLYSNLSNVVFTGYGGTPLSTITSKIDVVKNPEDMSEEELQQRLSKLTEEIHNIVNVILANGWKNKQWAIDLADKLNEESVRF